MDDYMFAEFVGECKVVQELTSYLEIFNYTNPHYDTVEEHALSDDEFENFLNRRGAFAPPERMPADVRLLSGVRLVVQKGASDKDTFSPRCISLPKDRYASMMKTLDLPLRAIETSAVVGPFFWCGYDQNDENPHLQILHRKSDVRKKGKTRGWEIMLSYSFKTAITTGFVKGTESSDIIKALAHLTGCARQVGHPMLLSTIILTYDLSPINDQKQREARDWLRRLENAVSMRDEVDQGEQYNSDLLVQVDGLNRDLVECHSHVMWKRPQAYFELVLEMEVCLNRFKTFWPMAHRRDMSREEAAHRQDIDKLHRSMVARMEFYKVKLKGLENYIHTTLERLKVQREALYNIMTQREARLNLQIADEASVSAWVWVYFAMTIPITFFFVAAWIWYDRQRKVKDERDEKELQEEIDNMEKDIMATMRRKTMSRAHTWNTALSMGGAPV
ncbi:hypothetical protein ESCO_002490 [Escovopsis weberi]|uniref:Uncharacterized protein n=1 Tax=Escovopsis weberi TaxID=150374 RepID=A0A0N0RT71_ESCWE|nr:hypothetical protein ESCO_002490 [Escovopsis weberi]